MLNRFSALVVIISLILVLGSPAARADAKDDAVLLKALDGLQVTLEDGLKASEVAGQPISAKFEIEGGRLQLSIYTASNDGFREALISTSTGVLMSAEKITDTDDLADAGAQTEAMRAATVPLLAVAKKAAAQTQGSRVVSVTPTQLGGRPVAKVTLVRAGALITVNEDIK
jgi:hypothetical protein